MTTVDAVTSPVTNWRAWQHPTDAINGLVPEKVEQAIGILDELDIDVWITFLQETGDAGGDPAFRIIFGDRDMGRGLLLLSRLGHRVVICGGLDLAIPPTTGVWNEVIDAEGRAAEKLRGLLDRIRPRNIAVNFSTTGNAKADGLSYGDHQWLTGALSGTPYADRIVSAEGINVRLRGRKTDTEVGLIRKAITHTEEIFAAIGAFLRPGRTEREVYEFILREVDRRGLQTAWSRDHCPILTIGPVPMMGHTPPRDLAIEPGWTVQVDFGVSYLGFCADIQHMWYMCAPGETQAPAAVTGLFSTVRRGIDAIIAELQPGAPTWRAAAAAQQVLVSDGWPEFKYAVGHQLGRAAHDGQPRLHRRLAGEPETFVEAGNVFTAEGLETLLAGRGWISLEDDVLITPGGPEPLNTQQREIWLVLAS